MTEASKPYITVLSYSGGRQSARLLWGILRGEIEKPFRFLVLNADPGMEKRATREYNRMMRAKCAEAGIDFIRAPGGNLYYDIVNSASTGQTRIDNPPYWTRNEDGSSGKLRQKCTKEYKIAAMDRALRKYMAQKYSVSAGVLRPGFVEKWIGFTHDEWHRCSESPVQYIRLRFPLIELKETKSECVGYFLKNELPLPPPSVCVACFANGLETFKHMYEHEPEDWQIAVEVDNAVEQWKALGITEQEVFVSRSLVRLRDMPAMGFGEDDPEMAEQHCNSGVCFL